MDYNKFYTLVLSDEKACKWISSYITIYNKEAFTMLEQVRNGLVNDMYDWQVIESVTEAIRAEFNA